VNNFEKYSFWTGNTANVSEWTFTPDEYKILVRGEADANPVVAPMADTAVSEVALGFRRGESAAFQVGRPSELPQNPHTGARKLLFMSLDAERRGNHPALGQLRTLVLEGNFDRGEQMQVSLLCTLAMFSAVARLNQLGLSVLVRNRSEARG
jgi:hypothetical protein